MQPILSDLETLARRAGEILRAGFNQRPGFGPGIQVENKGAIDLVTEIDHRCEAFLLAEIKKHFPGDHIIAEESGDNPGDECCLWYIDPLDGTVNYAHGVPIFSVSIAYQQGGALCLGVVYDPMQDECFTAERGKGAWLNGQQIRVSEVGYLDNSLLVTGFPYDIRTHPETNLEHYAHLSLLTQGVRRLGSAAMDLCYVAAGRFDGFWEIRICSWDVAAGALIAEEAGALVTDIHGELDFLSPPESILAANPLLHPRLLKALHA